MIFITIPGIPKMIDWDMIHLWFQCNNPLKAVMIIVFEYFILSSLGTNIVVFISNISAHIIL